LFEVVLPVTGEKGREIDMLLERRPHSTSYHRHSNTSCYI